MTLPFGSRLGPYDILSPLGAGGFEVYKAPTPDSIAWWQSRSCPPPIPN
jgi:hypothetical protein